MIHYRFIFLFLSIYFISCSNNYDEVKNINKVELVPAGLTKDFVLEYTDSAVLKATLKSPLNIDFTNQSFPYSEFPNGLEIEFYDEIEGTTTVSSDYGIVYYQTRIVSLEGDVTIKSPDSSFVKSEQIYWDPEQEWLFSEKKVLFSSDDYTIRAKRLDADRSFKLLKTGKLDGSFLFTEN